MSKNNLAQGKRITASSYQNPYLPHKTVNGIVSESERWEPSGFSDGPHWLEVDLHEPTIVGGTVIYFWPKGSPDDSVRFELKYRHEHTWETIPGTLYSREFTGPVYLLFSKPVHANAIRLCFMDAFLSVAELQLYEPGAPLLQPQMKDGPLLEQVSKNADYESGSKVLVSQLGYHPEHKKKVIYNFGGMKQESCFAVKRADDGGIAFQGILETTTDDFGTFQTGDFSALSDEGEYYVQIGTDRSFATFRIQADLWSEYQKQVAMHYFGLRRIGENSVMGDYGDTIAVRWDDARTQEGKYKYIGKGFADGDDLRRFSNASLIAAQYCLLKQSKPFWDTADWIYDQVRWGLDGVLSFIGKNGLLESALHVRTPDIHYGTDGMFQSGDEGLIIDPIMDEEQNAHEYNSWNKEVIYTSLLIGPAEACLTYYDRDPDFFERVKQLVIRGYNNLKHAYFPYPHKYSLSAWIWLSTLLYKLTGERSYKDTAICDADRFMQLQVKEWHGDETISAKGWYQYIGNEEMDPWRGQSPRYGKFTDLDSATRSPWGEKPEQEIMIVPWIYQGMFRVIELLPEEDGVEAWKQSVKSYARDYLLALSRQNVFGLTPMKVGSRGLIRQRGNLSYQYHGEIGRMFHQMANGALLMKAGKMLDDSELMDAAWNHAYYFTGCNPLGVGAIYGLSTNIPSQQYKPDTVGKAYPGGTVNGFNCISAANDYPNFQYWEYYGYANLANLWFATEIEARRFTAPIEIWPRQIEEAPHSSITEEQKLHKFPVRCKGNFSYRFMAVLRDDKQNKVRWYVNGISYGNPEVGMITDDGLYTAPRVTSELAITIKAESVLDCNVFIETAVTVMPAPGEVFNLKSRLIRDPRFCTGILPTGTFPVIPFG